MHWRGAALGITLGWAAASCVVGPRYERPQVQLVAFHNTSVAEQREARSPAPPLDRWWTGFEDPELTRIILRAWRENLDLAGAYARVLQARASAAEAGSRLLPRGEANAQAAVIHQSLESPLGVFDSLLPGYDRNQKLYDFGATASWEIDLFGGLRRGAEAASAEEQAAAAEEVGVRITVAAEAADAYFAVRGDQARLKFAQDQIDTDGKLLELVRLRFAAGAASDREVAQSEALLAQARATVPPLRLDLESQMNRLDVLMGAQPGTYAKELSTPADIPAVPAIPVETAADALLRRRPDVIAAERQVAAANALIGVAIAEYYPKISLSALLGFESLNGSHLFTGESFQPEAAAGLRWRLFDFGRVEAQVAGARGAKAEALARYRQTVLRAAEDVEDALMALGPVNTRAGPRRRARSR